jgi:hypothetical protein
MHLNIYGFTMSIKRLSLTTKKPQQMDERWQGFHNATWTFIATSYIASTTTTTWPYAKLTNVMLSTSKIIATKVRCHQLKAIEVNHAHTFNNINTMNSHFYPLAIAQWKPYTLPSKIVKIERKYSNNAINMIFGSVVVMALAPKKG